MTHIFKQDRLNSRQTRWINDLWNQKLEIKYIKGKENVVADALSLLQINHITSIHMEDELDNLEEEYKKDNFFKEIWRLLTLKESNQLDDITRSRLRSYTKRFIIDKNRLYVKDDNMIRLCIPRGIIRKKILNIHHDSLLGGHQGVTRTYET